MISTDIEAAVAVLRAGGLVGMPTETVYGLAADALNRNAIAKVFAAKGRPTSHPLIVHVAGLGDVEPWAKHLPDVLEPLLTKWWPGPLTVLLPRSSQVLDEVTGGRDTVALRAPAHPVAQALLQQLGSGVVAPSANRFGRVSPTTAQDVVDELGTSVSLVLDGGSCQIGIESTIVDLSGSEPKILRHGHITQTDLETIIPGIEVVDGRAEANAPGMLPGHYAPNARVVVLPPNAQISEVIETAEKYMEQGHQVGVLAPETLNLGSLASSLVQLPAGGDPKHYAQVLYRRLRQADNDGVSVLVVVPPPPVGSGIAVADRLRRAAYGSHHTD